MIPDMWDPNNWDLTERVYKILLTPRLTYEVTVDYVDYAFFTTFLWQAKVFKRHARRKQMIYAYRSTYDRERKSRGKSLYLHIEIMKRMGVEQPTPEHKLVDHIDGNTFNCKRDNLQWATYAMNRVRGNKKR